MRFPNNSGPLAIASPATGDSGGLALEDRAGHVPGEGIRALSFNAEGSRSSGRRGLRLQASLTRQELLMLLLLVAAAIFGRH